MRTLSVCQPWAHAIIHGPKRIENRRWRTPYRGPLLIHAGRSRLWLGTESDSLPDLPPYEQLDYGCLLGTVDVTDCVPVEDVQGQPFAVGPYCLVLANPQPLPVPIPYRGQQRFFNVPDELLRDPAHYLLAGLS